MKKEFLLEVNNLCVNLCEKKSVTPIIEGMDFSLRPGECLGILGESGSGKSISMKSILGLLDTAFEISGTAYYNGIDLLKQSKENLRQYRGKEITMILQNPMTCFDPLCRINDQMKETWLAHEKISEAEIRNRSLHILESMQIGNKEEVLKKYPHQLSGGMLQRIMIGLALSMNPKILVADEPTTAIDAITQFEIMKEFQRIKKGGQTAMIFISHDLGVVSSIADRILVMNKGKVVDRGEFHHVISNSQDAYTKLLVKSKQMVMDRYRESMEV